MSQEEIDRVLSQIQSSTAMKSQLEKDIRELESNLGDIKIQVSGINEKRSKIEAYALKCAELSKELNNAPKYDKNSIQMLQDEIGLIGCDLLALAIRCQEQNKTISARQIPDKVKTRIKFDVAGQLHMSPNDPDPTKSAEMQVMINERLAPLMSAYNDALQTQANLVMNQESLKLKLKTKTAILTELKKYSEMDEELRRLKSFPPSPLTPEDVNNEKILCNDLKQTEGALDNKNIALRVTNSNLAKFQNMYAVMTSQEISSYEGDGTTGSVLPEYDTGPG